MLQSQFDHFSGVNFSAVDGAPKQRFKMNELELAVEAQYGEGFAAQTAHLAGDIGFDGLAAAGADGLLQFASEIALGHFHD